MPIYGKVLKFWRDYSTGQPSFKTGDSCINQLISTTHEIHKSFDDCDKVQEVFLDISKTSDKGWDLGLHYKDKNGI